MAPGGSGGSEVPPHAATAPALCCGEDGSGGWSGRTATRLGGALHSWPRSSSVASPSLRVEAMALAPPWLWEAKGWLSPAVRLQQQGSIFGD